MKNEKGLTLIGTLILVIIIALITFGIVYFVRMQVEKEKAEDEKVEILQVHVKIKSVSGEYLREKNEEKLVGTKLSDMQEDNTIIEFLQKGLLETEDESKKYYVLNQQNLNDLGLEKITLEENTYYIAEYSTGETFYTKGYTEEDGTVYYKVTELEEVNNK